LLLKLRGRNAGHEPGSKKRKELEAIKVSLPPNLAAMPAVIADMLPGPTNTTTDITLRRIPATTDTKHTAGNVYDTYKVSPDFC